MSILAWFLDLLYPPKCMFCHRLLESSETLLCGRCTEQVPEYDKLPPTVQFFKKAAAPLYYEGYGRDAILRFKFGGMQGYAQQFAVWMAQRVQSEMPGTYDAVSWVPCSAQRKWTRGFDQAELLAEEVAKQLQVPCVRVLKKIRHTPKQSSIRDPARRRANVLGAFRAVEPEELRGKRILLVDDILTTGATLSECGKTLRLAGSGDLVCVVAAVTRRNS